MKHISILLLFLVPICLAAEVPDISRIFLQIDDGCDWYLQAVFSRDIPFPYFEHDSTFNRINQKFLDDYANGGYVFFVSSKYDRAGYIINGARINRLPSREGTFPVYPTAFGWDKADSIDLELKLYFRCHPDMFGEPLSDTTTIFIWDVGIMTDCHLKEANYIERGKRTIKFRDISEKDTAYTTISLSLPLAKDDMLSCWDDNKGRAILSSRIYWTGFGKLFFDQIEVTPKEKTALYRDTFLEKTYIRINEHIHD